MSQCCYFCEGTASRHWIDLLFKAFLVLYIKYKWRNLEWVEDINWKELSVKGSSGVIPGKDWNVLGFLLMWYRIKGGCPPSDRGFQGVQMKDLVLCRSPSCVRIQVFVNLLVLWSRAVKRSHRGCRRWQHLGLLPHLFLVAENWRSLWGNWGGCVGGRHRNMVFFVFGVSGGLAVWSRTVIEVLQVFMARRGWEEQGFFHSGKHLISWSASDSTPLQPSGKIMSLTELELSPNRIYECYWMASKKMRIMKTSISHLVYSDFT